MWTVGGVWSTWREPTQTGEERANSTEKRWITWNALAHQTREKYFEGRTEREAPFWNLDPFRLSALLAAPCWGLEPRQRVGKEERNTEQREREAPRRSPRKSLIITTQLHKGTCTSNNVREWPAAKYSRNIPGGVGGALFQFTPEITQIWFCAYYTL